jgi:glyoxylase-like metal-dependent hydrolase (beta-lactamase superfamily II)
VNAYAIESDDGLVIVDCGVPKSADQIAAALRDMGRTLSEVGHILVTHHHPDHAGGLARLGALSGAQVYAHPVDARVITGDEPAPTPTWTTWYTRFLGQRMASRPRPPSYAVDHELTDQQVLPLAGGIEVLHTPGHTLGHVSFLLQRDRRTLFVGDAALNILGPRASTGRIAELVTVDQAAAAASFARLASLEFETALFGHGPPLTYGAAARFRAAARSVR